MGGGHLHERAHALGKWSAKASVVAAPIETPDEHGPLDAAVVEHPLEVGDQVRVLVGCRVRRRLGVAVPPRVV